MAPSGRPSRARCWRQHAVANPDGVPSMAWFKTRKGRGYGKYDNKSHGTPHAMNSPEFWAVRREFMARHGVEYAGVDEPAPDRRGGARGAGAPQLRRCDGRAARRRRRGRSDQRPAGGGRRPRCPIGSRASTWAATARTSSTTRASPTCKAYPAAMWKQPGEKAPNRAALAAWGAWVNATARAEYDRPLFIACSADLAESTNIAGFAKDCGRPARAGAGTTATPTCAARCCRRRSPSSPTPASAWASPPSTWPMTP